MALSFPNQSRSFDGTPLRAAYDEAVARLLNQPDIVRETVAKRERDVHALCDKALIAEGFLS